MKRPLRTREVAAEQRVSPQQSVVMIYSNFQTKARVASISCPPCSLLALFLLLAELLNKNVLAYSSWRVPEPG